MVRNKFPSCPNILSFLLLIINPRIFRIFLFSIFNNSTFLLQVIPLDITLELQKQIMSELEILYKVFWGIFPTGIFPDFPGADFKNILVAFFFVCIFFLFFLSFPSVTPRISSDFMVLFLWKTGFHCALSSWMVSWIWIAEELNEDLIYIFVE